MMDTIARTGSFAAAARELLTVCPAGPQPSATTSDTISGVSRQTSFALPGIPGITVDLSTQADSAVQMSQTYTFHSALAADKDVVLVFFADVDVPGLVTQHDELAIPIAVHNYLKVAQRVEVRLEDAPWFEHQGEAVQHLDLAPGEVGARHFRIRVTGVGPQTLRAHARGAHVGDAVERGVRITPDGAELHAPGAVVVRVLHALQESRSLHAIKGGAQARRVDQQRLAEFVDPR